jgi:hypothetical protein
LDRRPTKQKFFFGISFVVNHTLDKQENVEHESGEQEASTTCCSRSYCHGGDGVEDIPAKEVAECQGRSLSVHLLFLGKSK